MSKERAPWIKLWGRYAESATLAGMDPAHRWVGVCLMLLVRTASDTRGAQTTWAEHPNGEPMSIEHIADYAHVQVKLCKAALVDFLRRDFIAVREDGAFGLPKFWKYQETADAKRKRDGKVGGKSGGDSVQEERGESSSLREESPPTPSKKTRPAKSEPTLGEASVANGEATASPAKPDPLKAAAARVLARLSALRIDLNPTRNRPLKPTQTNLAEIVGRLREGEPESDLLLVVEHEADKVRRGGDEGWFNPSTPFRRCNWPTRLAQAQAASKPARAQRLDLSADDIAARRDEAPLPPISLRRKPEPEDDDHAAE